MPGGADALFRLLPRPYNGKTARLTGASTNRNLNPDQQANIAMAKKLTPEQEQQFTEIATDLPHLLSEDAFCRSLSEKEANDLQLSPELKAFFGKEISNLLLRR